MHKQSITSFVFFVTLSSMHVAAAAADQNSQSNAPVHNKVLSNKVIVGGTLGLATVYGLGELIFAYKAACKSNEKLTFVDFLKDKELLKTHLINRKVGNRAACAATGLFALNIGARYLNRENAPETPNTPDKKDPSNPANATNFRDLAGRVGKFDQRQRKRETKAREAELARFEAERIQQQEAEAERQRQAAATAQLNLNGGAAS